MTQGMIEGMKGSDRMSWVKRTALVLLIGLLGSQANAQQDQILLKTGRDRTAKVLSEDYNGLKVSLEGGSTSIAWKDIDSIKYGNAKEYYTAVDNFVAGKVADALPLLDALAADDKLRPVLRHGVLYHLGLVHQRLGHSDQAIATYEALLKEFPKSRFLLPVATNLLAVYLTKEDAAGAARSLDATIAAARASGMDAGFQAGFGLLRGKILEEQNKISGAEQVFATTASTSDADPEVIAGAKLGLARCAARSNRASEAERLYREIVVQDTSNSVLAGAWNGLGDLALAEGTTKRDQDGLRHALLSYLRGVVLYVPGREGPSEETERALAGAARSFRSIGELEANAERKKLFFDRAKYCRDQLAGQYPNSRYLKGL